MPFGLQPIHIVVIVIVALLVFGPRRLPQLGRWIGRTVLEFRKGARDMAEGFKQETASQEQAGARTPPTGSPGAGPESGSPSPYPETAAGRFCTSCGAPTPPDARFCNKCGTRLPA
jgi:sec-independent protein translocase protein TatA